MRIRQQIVVLVNVHSGSAVAAAMRTNLVILLLPLTLTSANRFSKFFHLQTYSSKFLAKQ